MPGVDLQIEILARTDARHEPRRSELQTIRQSRQHFQRYGLEAITLRDATLAKRSQRAMAALEAAGRVQAGAKGGATRQVYLRLTAAGDEQARRLVCLPHMAMALAELARLHELDATDKDAVDEPPHCWHSELLAIGRTWSDCEGWIPSEQDASEINLFFERLLPLLARGWVQTRASTRGHVWIAITTAGRPFAARAAEDLAGLVREIVPSVDATCNDKQFNAYLKIYSDAWSAEYQRLTATPPSDAQNIAIPISASPATRRTRVARQPTPARIND